MKKFRSMIFRGIQSKIFLLVILSTLLITGNYLIFNNYQAKELSALTAETNRTTQEAIVEISTETMHNVMDQSLGRYTELQAFAADKMLEDLKDNVTMLGDYAVRILHRPYEYADRTVNPPDPANQGIVSVQMVCEDEDHLPVSHTAGQLANMSDMLISMYESSEQINSCFIASPEGWSYIVDDRAGEKIGEDGRPVYIPVTDRTWFTQAAELGRMTFTGVETDYFSGRSGIICAVPVYSGGELVAVVGADLFLESIAEAADASSDENSFMCIINENGEVIYSPKNEGVFSASSEDAQDLRNSEYTELASFVRNTFGDVHGVRLVNVGNETYYMAGSRMKKTGWIVISVVDVEVTDRPAVLLKEAYEGIQQEAVATYRNSVAATRRSNILMLVIAFSVVTAAALFLGRRIVHPLETMTHRAGALAGQDLQFMMDDAYRTGDEIETLAESFAGLSEKTMHYIEEVKQATAEKERLGAEMNMAASIQTSQLPSVFPPYPDRKEFELYASMDPAREVGGDFYDFFLIDDDHLCLVMADVSGKGIPAALFMMVSKILIKTRILNGESPGQALANVNNQLMEGNAAEMFVTVWLAVLTISTGKGIAANAGHEHPVLRHAGEDYQLVEYKHSPAIAAMEDMVFKEHEFEMHPGDSLFVYTDGVPEASDKDNVLFGSERLLKALNSSPDSGAEETIAGVSRAIADFVGDAEQFDDITMLCLRYNGPAGEQKG